MTTTQDVKSAGYAYTWEQLSRSFRTLREVTQPAVLGVPSKEEE